VRGKTMRLCLLTGLMAGAVLNPAVMSAHAEGNEDKGNPLLEAPKPVVHKRKTVKKNAAKPAAPTAPTPYLAYAPAQTPLSQTPATLPVQPVTAAPPPLPDHQAAPPVARATSPEISLKCQTRVMDGQRFVSQGVFYIDLFPSAVFPDQQADFKFLFVDPAHKSLIRQTICLDTTCPAEVTGTAYALISRRTRHGDALRIILDRTTGAFYAEQIDKGIHGGSHLGETGWCTPQTLPTPLF